MRLSNLCIEKDIDYSCLVEVNTMNVLSVIPEKDRHKYNDVYNNMPDCYTKSYLKALHNKIHTIEEFYNEYDSMAGHNWILSDDEKHLIHTDDKDLWVILKIL